MKTSLIIGASLNEDKASNEAVRLLEEHGIPVFALGREKGIIGTTEVSTERENFKPGEIHTIGLYLKDSNQRDYFDWILSLQPKRVFFNPGAEYPEFEAILMEAGIEARRECMITCLNKNEY